MSKSTTVRLDDIASVGRIECLRKGYVLMWEDKGSGDEIVVAWEEPTYSVDRADKRSLSTDKIDHGNPIDNLPWLERCEIINVFDGVIPNQN